MREQLIIRWPTRSDGPFAWVRIDANGNAQGKIQEGALDACAELASGRRVVVLVPTVDVLLSRARVPTRNRRRLLQALPYAMEEQLSEDIAELHFALGPAEGEGYHSTAVVAKATLERWLNDLAEAGIRADVVMPDVLALPVEEGEWSLLTHGESALLRTGAASGFGCESESLPRLLQLALDAAGETRPQALKGYLWAKDAEVPAVGEFSVRRITIEHPLQVLVKGAVSAAAINLLQGAYSRRDQLQKLWRPWRAVAAVAVTWLVLQGVLAVFDIQFMRQELASVNQQIEQTFRAAFPSVRRIVDPRLQMEQQLRALRGQGQQQSALGLLTGVGEVLQGNRDAQLSGISFRDGRLDLELELKDLQSLDAIKQQAAERLQAPVEIVSAAAQKEKVAGRLRIGGGT